jgi:hypothetical protein
VKRVALLLVVLALAGCSGNIDPGRPPATSSSTGPIRVGLIEWTIVMGAHVIEPGEATLRVTNAGTTVHNLFVRGEDGTWHTRDLQPGEQQDLDIDAQPGEHLALWCDEEGHAMAGMRTELDVQGSS